MTVELGDDLLNYVPSGKEITVKLLVTNPQRFNVEYSLGWDAGTEFFSLLPPGVPIAADPSLLAFSFAFSSSAEHRIITFTLGKHVAAINRTFKDEAFSIMCDSPPNRIDLITTAEDSEDRAFIAFVLPSQPSDDDIAQVELSWSRIIGGNGGTASRSASDLAAVPAIDPIGDGSPLNRYFLPEVDPGYAYRFTAVLVDAVGQRSGLAESTSAPHPYTIVYDDNGSSGGDAPETATYHVEDEAIIPSCGTLYLTGYSFVYWNTLPDNSGTIYRAGDTFNIQAADMRLYAQWVQNGTLVSFDIGALGLEFALSSGSIVRGNTLLVSCGNASLAAGGYDWKWYVDGVQDTSQTSPSFTWNTAGTQPGEYILGCSAMYDERGYSGSFKVTVTY